MLDLTPDEKSKREHQPDPDESSSAAASAASNPSGPTEFVVSDSASTEPSREELREAVASLIRERDYLRKARDVQQVENASELAKHRAQTDYLSREREELVKDRDAWRDRANGAEERLARTLSGRVKRWLLRLVP